MADLFGYIYVIKFGPYYKIGKSSHFVWRWWNIVGDMQEFQPLLPFEAFCPFHFKCWLDDLNSVESKLHSHFSRKRLRGEWFELSDDDLRWLVSQTEIPMFTEPGWKQLICPPWVIPDEEQIPCPS